jgi:imidazolonepropionase
LSALDSDRHSAALTAGKQIAATFVVEHAAHLLCAGSGKGPKIGSEMRELDSVEDGAVAVTGGTIIDVGTTDEVRKRTALAAGAIVIDASGRVVSPGLIDPHTHPIYAGNRAAEFEARTLGASYEEIAAKGGGIRSTVRATRAADFDTLLARARVRLDRMLAFGTTTVEAKSGYGLSTESELNQLRVIAELNLRHPIELVATFLGAHEIPDEYRSKRGAYIDLLLHDMLPQVKAERLAEFSDVFCDRGVYSNEEARLIQEAARRSGLKLKFHADELASTGGAELAAGLGAISADHLIRISDAGIAALAGSTTMAVLLPGTSFSLGASHFAPGRKLVDSGVAVALATDCNAGSCNTESLQIAAALAAQHYRFTAAECWTAMTRNAACALGRGDRLGVLRPGYQADMVVWDMEDPRELPFHFGVNLAHTVIKEGRVAVQEGCIQH